MVSNSLWPHGLKPALLSMEFSRKEYWSELPLPTPGNIPKPGIEPRSLASPALAGRLPLVPPITYLRIHAFHQ